MRERILSWGDDFTIKDADGRDAYYIDGKVLSFGDKLSFKDMLGNELALIDQKLLSIGPQYELLTLRLDRRRPVDDDVDRALLAGDWREKKEALSISCRVLLDVGPHGADRCLEE